jgi:ribosomal-protein-alanine N-acetyltransferase
MADAVPVQIARVTGPENLDEVAALEALSFTNPWTRDMLAREIAQSDVTRLYVLRLPDGRMAAFCKCWLIFDELHVNTIAVDPQRRREGLARLLLQHVLADAASAGARRATLEVRRSNEAALKLYQQLGFSVCAVRPRYYTAPEEDALILWREGLAAALADPIQNALSPDPKP